MDVLLNPDPVPCGHRRDTIQVCANVWGETEADQGQALDHAQRAPSRNTWDFVEVDRRTGGTCPLNLKDPRALAADQGYGWAYVVYRAGNAR